MTSEVFNGDCLQAMKTFPDKHFELAICDPPYGAGDNLNIDTWNKKLYPNSVNKHKEVIWNQAPQEDYFIELFRVSNNQIIWGGNYFSLPINRGWIFWDKQLENTFNFSAGELAWTSFDKVLKKFTKSTRNSEQNNIHPTQKPVALYKWLLDKYASLGDKIFDSHMGSQSSRIAAYDLGYDYFGCEIDKDYFDAGNKRFEMFRSQLKLEYA